MNPPISASRPEDFLAALDALVDIQKSIARLQAEELAFLAACGDYAENTSPANAPLDELTREITFRSTAMELGAALRVSDRTVAGRISDARFTRERFPRVLDALASGTITSGHVRAVIEAGSHIEGDEARAEYQARIIPIAESETVARTRNIARVIASRLEPQAAAERMAKAACARSVRVIDLEDGLASLTAILPAVLAHGIHDRLTQAARLVATGERRAVKAEREAAKEAAKRAAANGSGAFGPAGATDPAGAGDAAGATGPAGSTGPARSGDPTGAPDLAGAPGAATATPFPFRRIDEIRVDLLSDLLLTGRPSDEQIPLLGRDGIDLGAIVGHIQVVVTAEALLGDEESLPILVGSGPIPIDQARLLASQQPAWDRLTIDPTQRTLLRVDRYRPTPEQKRYLAALDEHCRQPGCRRPARRCDIDHSHDAALGGATDIDNLSPLCDPHHTVKHADGWVLGRAPDGTMFWTSKHERVYPDVPRPTVAFMITGPLPDDEPAPF